MIELTSQVKTPIDSAILESYKARVISRPNPWVGAVIVPEGADQENSEWILGHTQRYGGNHAEVEVINRAREIIGDQKLRKSTLYVTLEPCNHFGNTPPCTELIIESGIKKVVIGTVDPDIRVSGTGIKRLIAAGITVEFFAKKESLTTISMLLPYLWQKHTGRPFILLKLASTLDGKIATRKGDSKWISSESSRKYVHFIRSTSDAIVVGANTVRQDDPELTARYGYDEDLLDQPIRIVLGDISNDNKVIPCIVFKGDIETFFDYFADYKFQQILVEGGSGVAKQFLSAGMINQILLFMAPKIYGGQDGVSLFGGNGADLVENMGKGSFESVELIGGDIKINYHTEDTVKFINLVYELRQNVGLKLK
jgi:diaminohydroxyphosphoribosylaminopyrimidine deaminase/5-amino-6-(5-phosphoribosylamino)uracil reductase